MIPLIPSVFSEKAARKGTDQRGTPEDTGKGRRLTVRRNRSNHSRHPPVYLRGGAISWDSSPCTVDRQGIMVTCPETKLPLEEQSLYRAP